MPVQLDPFMLADMALRDPGMAGRFMANTGRPPPAGAMQPSPLAGSQIGAALRGGNPPVVMPQATPRPEGGPGGMMPMVAPRGRPEGGPGGMMPVAGQPQVPVPEQKPEVAGPPAPNSVATQSAIGNALAGVQMAQPQQGPTPPAVQPQGMQDPGGGGGGALLQLLMQSPQFRGAVLPMLTQGRMQW